MIHQVTIKYIDWLIEQAQNRSHDDSWHQEWMTNLQQLVQQQQKELRIFFLTVDVLQEQYQEKYQRHDQLSRRLIQELSEHDDDVASAQDDVEQQNKHDEELLHFLEQQLHYWRTHATQQRDKKTKREQQYHQAYFLPMINTHYQRKYIRARDKSYQVEQQLSDLHHAMDFVKTRLKQHRQTMTARLQYRQALVDRQQQLAMEIEGWQHLMIDMKQAQLFWCQFDTQHIQPYLDLLLLLQGNGADRWTRLRQATLDYEQTRYVGLLHHWHHHRHGGAWDNISFVCTQCQETAHHWPCLDRQTTQLLCKPCFQYIQSQRIVKEGPSPPPSSSSSSTISNTQRQEKQLPPSLPPTSILVPSSPSLSMPSLFTSTTKSVHGLLNECKPFVKKMKSALALNSKLDLLAHHPVLVSRYLYRSLLP